MQTLDRPDFSPALAAHRPSGPPSPLAAPDRSARPLVERVSAGRAGRAARSVLFVLAAFGTPLAAATLEVSFGELPNDRGRALFALFARSEGFPDRAESAAARLAGPVAGGRARVVFENVAPGDYALSALHDANDSGAIDLNLFGIPTEKFGVSNVARGRPTWQESLFRIEADGDVIVIELRPLRFF